MATKKKPAFERGWLKRVMDEATAEVAKWPEGMRRGVTVKPARKRKAASVMAWVAEVGGVMRFETLSPYREHVAEDVCRWSWAGNNARLVRVRIVEVRR